MGCPSATAPPFTFTFAGSKPSLRVTASAATANASFNSINSTSSFFHPIFFSNFSKASTGAIITHLGSTPLTACPTMRAIGSRPFFCAHSSEVTTSAAAPSFVPGAFPAVTVPSFLNAGRSRASFSTEVSARGPSSFLNTIRSPFLCGISTGRICDSNRHSWAAATALRWLSTANRSCSSRLILYFSATSSPVCPMWKSS